MKSRPINDLRRRIMTRNAQYPEDLDFELPASSIALRPLDDRAASRLLHMGPQGIRDLQFEQLPTLLRHDDILVINDVRVWPVRVDGRKATGGHIEALLLPPWDGNEANALIRCNGRLHSGDQIFLDAQDGDHIEASIIRDLGRGCWRLQLVDAEWGEVLETAGRAPLPPYIERRRPADVSDRGRYQTVYAREGVAVAAPTAGLHFTHPLLQQITTLGVTVTPLCLEVGPGTFRPLHDGQTFASQSVAPERFRIPHDTSTLLCEAHKQGRRVIVVGTTALRALEAWWRGGCETTDEWLDADVFLFPGSPPTFPLHALVTNLHLPKSSLLALVASLAGTQRTLTAYQHARDNGYRFYSYGDAMFLEVGT